MMNGELLANEVLDAMGGDVDEIRRTAFQKFCTAVVQHIQQNAQINGTVLPGLATGPGGGPVAGALVVPPGSIT